MVIESGMLTGNDIAQMALLLSMQMALVRGFYMAGYIAKMALLLNMPMAVVFGT
jgi:hypothetical protein